METREIKFRAWTNWEKPEMVYSTSTEWLSYKTTLPLMQYTGLKDKNGVEIYEGDIVSDGYSNAVVNFKAGAFGIDHAPTTKKQHERILYSSSWEVIGNIYEHPHLLNL